MFRIVVSIFVVLCVSACSSADIPKATAIATSEIWQVNYSPELVWMAEHFAPCAANISNVGIVVQEVMQPGILDTDSDIILYWGDINTGPFTAYQLGLDSVAFIVHPENPIDDLSQEDLGEIYSGGIQDWESINKAYSGEIHVWRYLDELNLQNVFYENVMPEDLITKTAWLAPDVASMMEAIREDPFGIGFIPTAWLNSIVKPVDVIGGEEIRVPLVGLTREKITDQQKTWFACMQGILSQKP